MRVDQIVGQAFGAMLVAAPSSSGCWHFGIENGRGAGSGGAVLLTGHGTGKSALLDEVRADASVAPCSRPRGARRAVVRFPASSDLLRPAWTQIEILRPAWSGGAACHARHRSSFTGSASSYRAAATCFVALASSGPCWCSWTNRVLARRAVTAMRIRVRGSSSACHRRARRHRRASRRGLPPSFLARVERLELRILDRDDARALLRSVVPDVSYGVEEAVLDHTLGNPLTIVEITRNLSEAERRADTPVVPSSLLPPRLRDLYAHRFESLSTPAHDVVLFAALSRFDTMEVLQATCALAHLDVDEIEQAVDRGLVRDDGRIRFRHPLVRAAAIDLAVERRRWAHRHLADVMPSIDAAWHHASASLGPDESRSPRHSTPGPRSTGSPATARTRPRPAALRRAARMTTRKSSRAGRFFAAGSAALGAGDAGRAHRLLEESIDTATTSSERATGSAPSPASSRCGSPAPAERTCGSWRPRRRWPPTTVPPRRGCSPMRRSPQRPGTAPRARDGGAGRGRSFGRGCGGDRAGRHHATRGVSRSAAKGAVRHECSTRWSPCSRKSTSPVRPANRCCSRSTCRCNPSATTRRTCSRG